MKTTFFKPSIHGWPFENSFQYTLPFDLLSLTMRFCGGMCWTSLQRFYSGVCLPRNTVKPVEGDANYDEIYNAQLDSLTAGALWKILDWQESPDEDHIGTLDSLGYRTQQEWSNIKALLDLSKPVTLTLITSSNDGNPLHLQNNHRVVAYAYNCRSFYPGEGAPSGSTQPVELYIYDPNYPNYDDVFLTFYLGGDNSKIGLRHSKGKEVHGFFLDDKDRNYAFAAGTSVRIASCVQIGFKDAAFANYDLQFSYSCRIIPYFSIQIDGIDWKNNSTLQDTYEPIKQPDGTTRFINKQCPAVTGTMTSKLILPRKLSHVTVKLLDDYYYHSEIIVDSSPNIKCYPYVKVRSSRSGPQVCDKSLVSNDLFIKEPNPQQSDIQQLDVSPFRWIMSDMRRFLIPPPPLIPPGSIYMYQLGIKNSYSLGNVVSPILGNFVKINLAEPVNLSGTVKITKNGMGHTTDLNLMNFEAQKIFDGFKDNPSDYNINTTVEFSYTAQDHFRLVVNGQATFYGRSIIDEEFFVWLKTLTPGAVAKIQQYTQEIIERGLVNIVIEKYHPSGDPTDVLRKLRLQPKLNVLIVNGVKTEWENKASWDDSMKIQSQIVKQFENDTDISFDSPTSQGQILKSLENYRDLVQQKLDNAVVQTFAGKILNQLKTNPNVNKLLESL